MGMHITQVQTVAEQVDTNTTWAYDYKNPGNKSYYDANNPSNRTDGYSSLNQAAYGIAIGRYTNAQNSTQASNGVRLVIMLERPAGLATSIGAFSQAEDLGSTAIGTASRAKGFNSIGHDASVCRYWRLFCSNWFGCLCKRSSKFCLWCNQLQQNGNQSIAIGNSAPKNYSWRSWSG